MMTALDVISAMEEWAPGTLQEEWDNSGLCIGCPDTPVSGVLICLDCTVAIIDEALEAGVNMIISQRAYESNSKAITTSDSMLEIANGLKR